MHIAIKVKGYYEFEPAPAGTVITKADEDAVRAKKDGAGNWLLRVSRKLPDGETRDFECNPDEAQICRRFVALAQIDREETRANFIARHLGDVLLHHNHSSHRLAFAVHDDGPQEKELLDAFAAAGITDKAIIAPVMESYLGEPRITSEQLDAMFNTAAHKARRQAGGK